jgi:hypothetical protein
VKLHLVSDSLAGLVLKRELVVHKIHSHGLDHLRDFDIGEKKKAKKDLPRLVLWDSCTEPLLCSTEELEVFLNNYMIGGHLCGAHKRILCLIVVISNAAGLCSLNLLERGEHNTKLPVDVLTESLGPPATDDTLNETSIFKSFELFGSGFGSFPCGGGEGFAGCGSLCWLGFGSLGAITIVRGLRALGCWSFGATARRRTRAGGTSVLGFAFIDGGSAAVSSLLLLLIR